VILESDATSSVPDRVGPMRNLEDATASAWQAFLLKPMASKENSCLGPSAHRHTDLIASAQARGLQARIADQGGGNFAD